jgi:hypothetical protein
MERLYREEMYNQILKIIEEGNKEVQEQRGCYLNSSKASACLKSNPPSTFLINQ